MVDRYKESVFPPDDLLLEINNFSDRSTYSVLFLVISRYAFVTMTKRKVKLVSLQFLRDNISHEDLFK